MSVPETPGEMLGMILASVIQGGLNMRRKAKARRAMRDLLGGLRDIERQEAERRREAAEAVRRQMARGSAGDATRAQRRQVGRNPLDERFF